MLILYMLLITVADVYAIYTGKPEQTCGQNASYIECPSACPSTCRSPNERSCKKRCVPKGCHCNPSYILSKPRGQCILPDDCPGGNPCPQNETFVACSIGCPTNYCPVDDSLAILVCDPSLPCPSGCSCKPNYKRKSVKEPRCILAAECPPVKCTRPNEEWNPCTNSCLRENCYDLTTKNKACKPQGCEPRCACKNGYYRNDSSICVPESQCSPPPIKCGVNEEYSTCKIKCPPQFCNISYTDYGICPNDTRCEPGCNCIKDHLRDFEGKCVLNDNCPPPPTPCGGNATNTDCASSCSPTCETPKPKVCIESCKPDVKCQCMPSYVLSPNGDCILPQDCPAPPPVCGENEVSTICKTTCPSDSCDSEKQQAICKPGPCRLGCNCKEGYARDSDGKCIPKEQCPKIPSPCGGNATYTDCASSCPPTCETPKPGVCILGCKPNVTCQCKPSYVLSPNGDCILPQDCPAPPPLCGETEVSTICKTTCPSDSCDSEKQQAICKPGPCRPGCNCKEGYARDSDGKCIPKKQCPKIPSPCGGNATYTDCASSCPPTCETPKPGVCILGCKPNVTCQCKPSYVLSPNGDCILPQDCPAPPPLCGENEVSTICKTTCPSDSCDSEKQQAICKPGPCRLGCNCKEGYARDSDGKCIPKKQCPKTPSPCGGNATYTDCASSCPPTCETLKPGVCILGCKPNVTCQCKPSYVLSPNGDCILPQDCPAPPPLCGETEVSTICKTTCPSDSCDSEKQQAICKPGSCRPGCNCKEGYARDSDGKCIPKKQCPKTPSPCGGNATYTDCASSCPPTCETPKPGVCILGCKPNVTCQCKPSYVLSPNGDCILPQDCPAPPPVCGENEVSTICKTTCPSDSCDSEKQQAICKPGSCRPGCNCKEGYARDSDGKCIPKKQCPKTPSPCGGNATYTDCASSCPPTCETPKPGVCILGCKPNVTCQCKPSYVLSPNGDCILPQDCPAPPPVCGENEVSTICKTTCPSDSCDSEKQQAICKPGSCRPGCNCKEGYARDSDGKCIPKKQCPKTPSPCGGNATYTDCASSCPPTCETPKPGVCILGCKPNVTCQCMPSYVLSPNGDCILPQDCPEPIICGGNATLVDCTSACPLTCETPKSEVCIALCKPKGCECKPSYVLSPKGDCILPQDCPAPTPCGGNATATDCASSCPPTCQTPKPEVCATVCKPNAKCKCKPSYVLSPNGDCILPQDCPAPSPVCGENEVSTICKTTCPSDLCDSQKQQDICRPGPCRPGCNCKEGYARDSDGKCIPKEQCPKTPSPCGGNATYTDCASSCPPTCETPKPGVCILGCKPNVTCQCKPSYVLSPNGDCILPKDCPGGSPCSQNETFVSCNVQCPNSYCPVDDRQGILLCDPPRPCPSGCSCKLNYKRKSIKDPQCILAEDCPPVKCTRPNEEWNACPTSCLKENCEDLKLTNTACKPSRTNCQPRCACKEGFYRNSSRICVPASECFPSKTCDIPDECKATCAEPNPKNCPYQSATENVEGCKCKPGYVLSDKNGECIRIEECPEELGCNGDNNSYITKCPPPCPSTCQSPNEVICKKSCLPVGCKCKDGFILSKLNGLCIKPDNCTGGNPCKNGAFSSCNSKCSYNYCPIDDSPPDYNCSAPSPCRPGCVCRFNHRKKSFSEDQCILASDCPPVNCTRPNEVWDSCPSACLNEGCENAGKKPPVCNTLILNCQPRCVCKPNTYRDKNNVCVSVDQCPTPPVVCGANEVETCQLDDDYDTEVSVCKPTCVCKEKYSRDSNGKCVPDTPPCASKTCNVPPECRRTCAEPNPKNCSYQEVFKNKNGCKCKPGYILLDKDGKCVKIEDCPSDLSCNGDANALVSQCPSPCPSTCSAPNEILYKKACLDVGCKCKEGFILSKLNGLCIPPEKCKGGNPCGKNATFSSCSSISSYNYCPKDDSPLKYNCALPYRCPSGCVCNLNYRRKSIDDRQCILASECPPVICTRPNEVWDSCPSGCLQERCEDAGKDPVPCNTFVLNCQPKCVCKANTFRNKDNICVPVNKCPKKKSTQCDQQRRK